MASPRSGGGQKMRADDAIDFFLPAPMETAVEGSESSGSGSSSVVDAMIAKYGMSPADAAVLKQNIKEISPAADAASEEKVRAKAPVQLLASTRRIGEFSTSKQPGAADRVVYVRGSFDMFHVGHAQLLKDAKALGTFLLVGIVDDATARQHNGPSFPVMNLTERVLNVCACKWVDEVIIGAPRAITEDLMKTWDVNIVARGIGHTRNFTYKQDADHFEISKQAGVYTEVASKWPELNHDTIVERIMSSRHAYLKRNADRASREDAYYKAKLQKTDPKEV